MTQRAMKFISWCAIALGCSCLLHAAAILFGSLASPDGTSCKVICGLALLTVEVFGAFAGALVNGLLWLGVGATFFRFGYLALRK